MWLLCGPVYRGLVPATNRLDNWTRRQDGHSGTDRGLHRCAVPIERPRAKHRIPFQEGSGAEGDHCSVWQCLQWHIECHFVAPAIDPRRVDCRVKLGGGWSLAGAASGNGPGLAKPAIISAAAGSARAMPGCQGGRLVEKEQLSVSAWLHQGLAIASAEGECAGNPGTCGPAATAKDAVTVVQAAAVTHESAARFREYDLAEWCDTVLQRHGFNITADSPTAQQGRDGTAQLAAYFDVVWPKYKNGRYGT